MSNLENIGVPAFNSMEEAWAKAKEEGYTGSLEEFDALCKKAAEDILSRDEAMDPESLDAIAGGKNVLKAIGDWCADNKELLIATGTGIATAATVYGVYHYMTTPGTGTGTGAGEGGLLDTSSMAAFRAMQV